MTKNNSKIFSDWNNFINNLKKNKSDLKDVSDLTFQLSDNIKLASSEYQNEINEVKSTLSTLQSLNDAKNNLIQTNNKEYQSAQNLIDSYQDAANLASSLSASSDELTDIYNSAIEDIISGTKSFSETMKNVLNDLKNYFLNAILSSLQNNTISSSSANLLSSSLNSATSISGSLFSGLISSVFSSHHSGGLIPSGTGYSLPGTSEYLSVLKGGERVLSPSETSSYNSSQSDNKNYVVNNFNIKAWDSKDVQQYLLENKNLLANITAENIKYNNANLKYAINGM
jgi:dGTP triphosphohydrolase